MASPERLGWLSRTVLELQPDRPRTKRRRNRRLDTGDRLMVTEAIRTSDPCVTEADARRRRNRATTTRPQGGAVTEWYKGKTRLPVCRQISSGICRRVAGSIAWRHRQCRGLSSRQIASVIRFGSARGGHHDITCHLHRTHRVRQRDITGNLRPSDLGGFAAVEFDLCRAHGLKWP